MARADDIDALIGAALADRLSGWPIASDGAVLALAAARIAFHGVAGLLSRSKSAQRHFPAALLGELQREAKRQNIVESIRRAELTRLTQAFARARVEMILLKGARLAYTLYDDPADRPLGDADALVRPGKRGEAEALLQQLGYHRETISRTGAYQQSWQSSDNFGQTVEVDLHWQISTSPALASLFTPGIFGRAVRVPGLGEFARGTSAIDTLLQIALNRAWHARNGFVLAGKDVTGPPRLGWTYDIHLLAGELTSADWTRLHLDYAQSAAAPLLLQALGDARDCFGTHVPAQVLDALADHARPNWLTRYIAGQDSAFRVARDLRALPDLRAKADLVLCHLFPPPERVYRRFSSLSGWPVWALRILRLLIAPARLLGWKGGR